MKRLLGLDPSLNKTGWVILIFDENAKGREGIGASDYGLIKPNAKHSLGAKLLFNRIELQRLLKKYRPDVVVFEETFAGQNALTTSRLNNAKGVFVMTAFEFLKDSPVMVYAGQARACLGFSNDKEEPFAFFKREFNLPESFKEGNDITDAYVVGYWYIINQREACVDSKRKKPKNDRKRSSKNSKKKKE